MSGVYFDVYGQGLPLVMIPGWSMHSGVWRVFALQLAEHCQVICVDLPGHGRSSMLQAFTLEAISDAVVAALPVERFGLLGWSLGASVALVLAERFPERVQAVQLLSGNPRFVANADWPGVDAEIWNSFVRSMDQDVEQALQRFLGLQVQGLVNRKRLLQQLKQAIAECGTPNFLALQWGLQLLERCDLRSTVAGLRCPITMIQGDRDALVPLQVLDAVKLLSPTLVTQVLAGAGHAPFLTHQSALVEMVVAAL